MSGPRLSRALGASAGAHLVVLAALLSLVHTAPEHTPPAMRVSLVEGGAAGLAAPSEGSTPLASPARSTRSAERPAATPPVTVAPGTVVRRAERRTPPSSGSPESGSPSAAATNPSVMPPRGLPSASVRFASLTAVTLSPLSQRPIAL